MKLDPISYVSSSDWPGYTPNNAFDNKENTYWHCASNFGLPQYCGAKFERKVHINNFYLSLYYMSSTIILQGSNDGKNWVNIQTYTCKDKIATYDVNDYNDNYLYYCINTIKLNDYYVAYKDITFFGY